MAPSVIDEALDLLSRNDPVTFQAATETLFKIVQNVLQHPDEAKYRTLRRKATAFAQKVGAAKGGVRFLRAVGFVDEGEGDEAALTLPAGADTALIQSGKAALKACVKERMQEQLMHAEQERQRANELAAGKLAELRAVSKQNTAQRDQEAAAERQRVLDGIKIDRDDWVRQRDPNNVK